ncbi:MAG: flagellar biosynthesis protein FlgL [Erythrobacter sp.]
MIQVSNPTRAFFERAIGQMAGLRGAIETSQTQIATGERLQRGSDDPVGASRLRALARLEGRGVSETENAGRLAQDLAQADLAIGDVIGVLQRARDLAIAAANDPIGANGREAIARELEQLESELFTRANSLSVTQAPLFGGTAAAPAYLRGLGGAVVYNGNNTSGAVPIASRTEIERGVTGPQVFEFTLAGVPSDSFAVLSGLAADLRNNAVNPATAARDALAGIDAAIDTANRSQTVIGTRLAFVEDIQINQEERAIERAQQRSAIADTDLAETIARLQQTLTALEASQASFARISSLSLFDVV